MRWIKLTLLVMTLTASLPAAADGRYRWPREWQPPNWTPTITSEQTQQRLLLHLLLMPLYGYGTVLLREAVEGTACLNHGCRIEGVRLWPRVDREQHSLRLASVDYDGSATWPSPVTYGFRWQATLFAATDTALTLFIDPDSGIAPVLLSLGMIAPLVDLALRLNGFGTDFNRLAARLNLNGSSLRQTIVVGNLLLALAAWRVSRHAQRILLGEKPRPLHATVMSLPLSGGRRSANLYYGLFLVGWF